jgi:hypothetical protein
MSAAFTRVVMLSAAWALAPGGVSNRPVAAFGNVSAEQATNPDAKAVAAFTERVKAYVALHQKLEASAPSRPKEATPRQIDQAQRSLAALLQSARADAKQGDLFTPEMTAFVTGLLKRVFAGTQGRQLRESIMDENVVAMRLKVNQLYPDALPLSTMPPQVLEALPRMPEELEYRFIGDHLILLDPHAHIIADFIPNALPPQR